MHQKKYITKELRKEPDSAGLSNRPARMALSTGIVVVTADILASAPRAFLHARVRSCSWVQ